MRCSQCEAQLPELLEGALRAGVAAALERHLAGCAACRDARDIWRALRTRVAAAPLPGPGPEEPQWDVFEARVLAHVRDRPVRRGSPAWWGLAPIGAMAAVVALAVVLRGHSGPPPAPSEPARVATSWSAEEIAVMGEELALAWDAPLAWNVDDALAELETARDEVFPRMLARAFGEESTVLEWIAGVGFAGDSDEWLDDLADADAAVLDVFLLQLERPVTS